MSECEFIKDCQGLNIFLLAEAKGVWRILYCRGSKKEECALRKLRLEGKKIPEALLPNGTYFPISKLEK